MRSGSKNRRSRGRGNGGRWGNTPRNHNFESNGPDGKVRGTAQQVVDKYQALAREATTAGDPIKAEGYFQFAEHYLRVLMVQNANMANAAEAQQGRSEAKDREKLENRLFSCLTRFFFLYKVIRTRLVPKIKIINL